MGLTVMAGGGGWRSARIWGQGVLLSCLLCSHRVQIIKQSLSRQNGSCPAQHGIWCQSKSTTLTPAREGTVHSWQTRVLSSASHAKNCIAKHRNQSLKGPRIRALQDQTQVSVRADTAIKQHIRQT